MLGRPRDASAMAWRSRLGRAHFRRAGETVRFVLDDGNVFLIFKQYGESMMTKGIAILVPFLLLLSTPAVMAQELSDTIASVQLLRMMDADLSGKVSRAEFMRFMSEEFDKLDVNKDGELDVRELEAMHLGFKHAGGSGHR